MSEKDRLIRTMRDIAEELCTRSVPRHEFLRRAGISERVVQKYFGTYNALVEAAGLEPRTFPTSDAPAYSDDDLLAEVVSVLRFPNSKLTRVFFEQNAEVSSSVCERRFGGWINTLRAAAARLDLNNDSALLERLQEYTAPSISQPAKPSYAPPTEDANGAEIEVVPDSLGHGALPSGSANIYGDFINFRGLQHAPVNEQGVVFLFGMICRELGYVVEIVKSGFPDCEAKRKLRGKPGLWQRVRIEFEFQSRNFRSHGHDPDQPSVPMNVREEV